MWKETVEVFNFLPIAGLIAGKIFSVHGGLSPKIMTIDQIRILDRRREIPEHPNPFTDLMWSDPEEELMLFCKSPRGAGWLFGYKVTEAFCLLNNLTLIQRAHQLCQEGFEFWHKDLLVTIWSAPNYCYKSGNDATIM